MGERSGAPWASALHQSSFRNLRLRFNYRSQMSQLTVTHPTERAAATQSGHDNSRASQAWSCGGLRRASLLAGDIGKFILPVVSNFTKTAP